MQYLIGAHYVCLRCLRRGIEARCARCAESHVVSLLDEEGRRRLARRQVDHHFEDERRAPWDPRALVRMPPGRRVLWIGARLALIAGFAAGLMLLPGALWIRILFAMIAGATTSLLLLGSLAVLFMITVGLAGLLARASELVRLLMSLRRRRSALPDGGTATASPDDAASSAGSQTVLDRLLAAIERSFVSRVRPLSPTTLTGAASVEGIVRAVRPPITLLRAATSAPELADAEVKDSELELATGERVQVIVHAGTIDCAKRTTAIAPDTTTLPFWIERATGVESVSLGDGTRLLIHGGLWSEAADPSQSARGFRNSITRRVLTGNETMPVQMRVVDTPVLPSLKSNP